MYFVHELCKLQQIEKENILRRIWGPLTAKEQKNRRIRHRRHAELYENKESEMIAHAILNRRDRFVGRIMRMTNSALTKQIFNHVHKSENSDYCIQSDKNNMLEVGISKWSELNLWQSTFQQLNALKDSLKKQKKTGNTDL